MILFIILVACAALGVGITLGLALANFATNSENEEVVFIQDAWEAAGGNPGITPTKEELFDALRVMDEVVDAVDTPTVPDSVLNLMAHIEDLMDVGIIPEEAIKIEVWNAVTNDVIVERNREIFVGF